MHPESSPSARATQLYFIACPRADSAQSAHGSSLTFSINTPAKIALFSETIKHFADYFQKTTNKSPDASRTGAFLKMINLKYRTITRTIDFFMRIRTHTCAMLEDRYYN